MKNENARRGTPGDQEESGNPTVAQDRDGVEVGDTFDLIEDENGRTNLERALLEVVEVGPPRHAPYGPRDVRVYAVCNAIEHDRKRVLKVWFLICDGCRRGPGTVCAKPKLKPGPGSVARMDLALGLGRRLTPKERPHFRCFLGRRFRANLRVCAEDSDGNPRPAAARYTVSERFLEEETRETSTFTLTDTVTSTFTTTNTTTTTTTKEEGAKDSISEEDTGDHLQRAARLPDGVSGRRP